MASTRRVVLESRKYGGGRHRLWPVLWLVGEEPGQRWGPGDGLTSASGSVPGSGLAPGEDLVFWGPRGTPVREADGRRWFGPVPVLMYFRLGRYWNAVALLHESGAPSFYCNVCLPVVRAGRDRWRYVDLDLDVLVGTDLRYEVLDREEFLANAARLVYPPAVVRGAEEGLADLLAAVAGRRGPFAPGAESVWLARVDG